MVSAVYHFCISGREADGRYSRNGQPLVESCGRCQKSCGPIDGTGQDGRVSLSFTVLRDWELHAVGTLGAAMSFFKVYLDVEWSVVVLHIL